MTTRRNLEKALRCNEVKNLDGRFKAAAHKLAVQYVTKYSVREVDAGMFGDADCSQENYPDMNMCGFGCRLSVELTRNRIENLMYDALMRNPDLTVNEYERDFHLPGVFIDENMDGIKYLIAFAKLNMELSQSFVELFRKEEKYLEEVSRNMGEDNYYFICAVDGFHDDIYMLQEEIKQTEDYIFLCCCHFFSAVAFSFLSKNSYHVNYLDKAEIVLLLYTEAYNAVKNCAKNNTKFNFVTLQWLFKAVVVELGGIQKFPFTIRRHDLEIYNRFRVNIERKGYTRDDDGYLAGMLSVSLAKINAFWKLYVLEQRGFVSESELMEEDAFERMVGGTCDEGYERVEFEDAIERCFHNEDERRIVEFLIDKAGESVTKPELEKNRLTRYRINQVKETAKTKIDILRPIK